MSSSLQPDPERTSSNRSGSRSASESYPRELLTSRLDTQATFTKLFLKSRVNSGKPVPGFLLPELVGRLAAQKRSFRGNSVPRSWFIEKTVRILTSHVWSWKSSSVFGVCKHSADLLTSTMGIDCHFWRFGTEDQNGSLFKGWTCTDPFWALVRVRAFGIKTAPL